MDNYLIGVYMRIILDVMGGDNPPEEFVKGAYLAVKKYKEKITLVGNEKIISDALRDLRAPSAPFDIIDAPDFVSMEDDPMSITGAHAGSSMAVSLRELSSGGGDAVVSAGNTGALFTGATLIERRVKGVRRAALSMVIPFKNPILLLDCGANVSVTPEYLVQFAYLGKIYMERILGVDSPRVALLNNGAETHKGTPTVVEANKLLSDDENINFVGNIEGKDVPFGECDVLVTDGFTGNIFLKTCEGMSNFMMARLTEKFFGGVSGKISAMLKKNDVSRVAKMFDAKEYGGAPFLGLAKPVIKAHGNSDARAVCAAIGQARKYVETNIIDEIASCADIFSKMKFAPISKRERTENE